MKVNSTIAGGHSRKTLFLGVSILVKTLTRPMLELFVGLLGIYSMIFSVDRHEVQQKILHFLVRGVSNTKCGLTGLQRGQSLQ